MAAADPTQGSEAPFRTMSIARFIPRFARPQLLTTNIPTYRQSFSHPAPETLDTPNDLKAHATALSKQEKEEPTSASYIEWSKLLPVPSNLVGSFQDLFEGRPDGPAIQKQASTNRSPENADTLEPFSATPPPRLVFFGEQHHQPQVMRAQLQTLHALQQQCQLASKPQSDQSDQSDAPPIYRLHLILEHFSVLDQHMLNSFSHGHIDPDQLADQYREHSQEAFHIGHYMPLLMLAKELHVPIWGGFPPRSWAKHMFRDGVEAVKPDEQRRANPIHSRSASSPDTANGTSEPTQTQIDVPSALPRSPLFTSWSAVTKIGAAHRSYLSGLMRPDVPPRFPKLPSTPCPEQAYHSSRERSNRRQPIYPTWLLKPHNIEAKGFGPAQALKDSYLAHVTAWILRGQDGLATADLNDQSAETTSGPTNRDESLPSQHAQSSTKADESASNRPVVNIALVVCGLGHCEYGFGAPERVVQLLSEQSLSSDNDAATLLPYIIASKPLDSGIWLGYEHPSQPSTVPADGIPDTQQHESDTEQRKAFERTATSSDDVKRWLNDPWGRKMADAVLLYDWIDQGPTGEADADAQGHQPSSEPSS